MYHSFYHLNQDPFQISTDPKFLWLGEKHKEALATLNYGIFNNKSFLLLTGDVGTGKTTLINALLRVLDKDTLVAIIQDPGLEQLEFFNYIANAFGLTEKFTTKGDFLLAFRNFLRENFYKGKKVILLIDEAQRIKQEMLEEVRLLSNIEIEGSKLINIFFVGQNEFNSLLLRPENKAMRQRITTSFNIPPLTVEEVGKYIEYRLAVAGARERIFDKNAIKEVFLHSKGYPRLINILCDRALLTGFVKGVKKITGELVRESAEELDISGCTTSGYIAAKKELFEKKDEEGKRGAFKKYSVVAAFLLLFMYGSLLWYWAFSVKGGAKPLVAVPSAARTDSGEKKVSVPAAEVAAPQPSPPQSPQVSKPLEQTPPGVERQQPPREAAAPEKMAAERHPAPRKVTITFATNSITPDKEESFEKLKMLADGVLANPETQVVIRGYTDATGPEEYNRRLSEFRANAIRNFLIGRGIDPGKIQSSGQGGVSSVAAVGEGGEKVFSRRVEVEVLGNRD
ncbi:AAA family ATPase [Thiovibrio sp. JS02]